MSQDCHATFVRVSRACRREILANLRCETFATLVRMLCDSRATVLRKHENTSRLSGEIKLSDIRTNVVRHSHECLFATVIRMKMKATFVGTSWDTLANVLQLSHDSRPTTVAKYIFNFRPKFANCRINDHSARLQRESCVYIVNLCREIVANKSRTSLQLSHSSAIRALRLSAEKNFWF